MKPKYAARMARTSVRTIHRQCASVLGLAVRIGGRFNINDEIFINMISNGTGLLDYTQAREFVYSIVGERYGNTNQLTVMLEELIPEEVIDAHPDKGYCNRGYWHVQCIPWKTVKSIAYEMEMACYLKAKTDERKYSCKRWDGRTPSWLLDEMLMDHLIKTGTTVND